MRTLRYLTLGLSAGCAAAGVRQATPAPAPAAASAAGSQAAAESMSVDRAQYPSTYRRHPNPPVLIRNATIMTATGQEIRNGSILFKDGRIVAVGEKVDAPADAAVVDGAGKYVTPGLIDDHSHLGVYAAPLRHGWATWQATAARSRRRRRIAAGGTRGERITRAIRPSATCGWRRWRRCCAATCTSRTIVIAPTRWRR